MTLRDRLLRRSSRDDRKVIRHRLTAAQAEHILERAERERERLDKLIAALRSGDVVTTDEVGE